MTLRKALKSGRYEGTPASSSSRHGDQKGDASSLCGEVYSNGQLKTGEWTDRANNKTLGFTLGKKIF